MILTFYGNLDSANLYPLVDSSSLTLCRQTVMLGFSVVTSTCFTVYFRYVPVATVSAMSFYPGLGDDVIYYIIGKNYLVYYLLIYFPPLVVTQDSNPCCAHSPHMVCSC